MEKEFVPYEEALVLKSLGFKENCFKGYFKYSSKYSSNSIQLLSPLVEIYGHNYLFNNQDEMFADTTSDGAKCSAPLYQQAFSWFRETYGKHVILFSDGIQWTFDLRWVLEDDILQYPSTEFPKKEVGRTRHDTYEEAQLTALRKLIEIIKT